MRTRVLAASVTLAAAAIGVAGCGGSDPGGDSPSISAPRTAATSGAAARSSARQALTAAVRRLGAERSADFTAVENLYGKRSTTSGTCTWGSEGYRIKEYYDSAAVGMQSLVHGTLETRQIGTALYYRVGPLPSGPYRGRHWMKLDLSALSGAQAAGVAADSARAPGSNVRDLAGSADVRRVGPDTVDGRATTHFSGHVAASAEQRSIGLVEPALVDVWLTADGTLVRYGHSVAGVDVTMDYTHFGSKPPIAVPAAGDTVDRSAAAAAARQKALNKALHKS